MADKKPEKKPEKKAEAPKVSLEQNIVFVLGVIALLMLIVIPAVFAGFGVNSQSVFNADSFKEGFIGFAAKLFTSITFISVFVSLLFGVLIFYAKMRYNQVIENWKISKMTLGSPLAPYSGPNIGFAAPAGVAGLPGQNEQVAVHGPIAQAGNEKWQDIESKINSANPSDWRLAILEADIVLFEMLEQMGLPGETLGEKLKSADSSFFGTIQEAWGAHKIRNVIAHEGSGYALSYNEARRAIDLYRRVFEEFYFI